MRPGWNFQSHTISRGLCRGDLRFFNSVQEAFSEGKLGYLDVLDAERTLFEVRDEYIQALASYHEARAAVEGILGRSLENLAPTSEGTNQE